VADLTETGTSRSVETPSGTVHYNEAGPADGHPIVMLHGSGAGATGWSNFRGQMQYLADRYRVIAVDMPGWGASAPATYEQRNHPVTAIEFLDALGIEKAAFVGNSMGGATSLKVTADHPERVTHLVTLGSGAPGVRLFLPGGGPSEGYKLLLAAYRDPRPEQMQKFVDVFCFDERFRSPELAKERSDLALAHPEHLANFVAGIGRPRRGTATEEEIAGITVPTLIIHGRDDRVVPYENGLKLCALIPDSRLVVFNQCGHWAQVEKADEFNRLLDDFVAH
jgi:2-hydroxy-6-oxonona-2,4-dienedioate hydrolase